MKVVVRTDEYTIFEKRNSRYGVRRNDRQWVNGDDKVAILSQHDLIKAPPPKAPEPEAPAEEATGEAASAAEASADESADETSGDEAPAAAAEAAEEEAKTG